MLAAIIIYVEHAEASARRSEPGMKVGLETPAEFLSNVSPRGWEQHVNLSSENTGGRAPAHAHRETT